MKRIENKVNLFTGMNHYNTLSVLFISVFILITGCHKPDQAIPSSQTLRVNWRVIKNEFGEENKCHARFVFKNEGSSNISGENWRMYFNQATLHVENIVNESIGIVAHINGDFYQFVPGKNFQIKPGDSIVYDFTYKGIMIKEGDAPTGLYIVSEKGGSQNIEVVKNYQVLPFSDFESIFPGDDFKALWPTSQNEYLKNEYIKELPDANVGNVIPTPYQTKTGKGKFEWNASTTVYYDDAFEKEAIYLIDRIKSFFNLTLKKQTGKPLNGNSISLQAMDVKVNGVEKEAYLLNVAAKKGIVIEASDAAGMFYGIQTLLSMMEGQGINNKFSIDEVEIQDAPRFAFRGFLLDVARNFQSKQSVLKLIDLLATYKINHLNLRLTEDEAWRLEIASLPELTELGSKRGHTLDDATCLIPAFGSGPFTEAPGTHGSGYYTRNDFIEIIKYAGARHIKIVPEICFPSHARAAIKSMEFRYRKFIDKGDKNSAEEFRLIDPNDKSQYYSAQQFKDNIVNVCNESTYHFYETVVKDIKSMYDEAGISFDFLHTGGDEVPNGAWAKSPECTAFMQTQSEIENPRHLQAYFFKRMSGILKKYNLTLGGWEEVVLKKDSTGRATINTEFVNQNVIPYVWDNTGDNVDLGNRIANAGYKVILCNVKNLYFDLSYNTDPKEPGLYWGGFQDAIDPFLLAPFDVFKSEVYTQYGLFNPAPTLSSTVETLRPESRKNIFGLQAQLWSETVKGSDMLEYYVIPKLFAFAEKAWARERKWESESDNVLRIAAMKTDWNEMANRIGKNELPRLDKIFGGFNYRIATPGAQIENATLYANVSFPGFVIRYSTDGTEPNEKSPVYTEPVKVQGAIKVKAFNQQGRGSRTITVFTE
jgi:hexosaminidase